MKQYSVDSVFIKDLYSKICDSIEMAVVDATQNDRPFPKIFKRGQLVRYLGYVTSGSKKYKKDVESNKANLCGHLQHKMRDQNITDAHTKSRKFVKKLWHLLKDVSKSDSSQLFGIEDDFLDIAKMLIGSDDKIFEGLTPTEKKPKEKNLSQMEIMPLPLKKMGEINSELLKKISNRKFYLYSYEARDEQLGHCLVKAVIEIGATMNEVTLKNPGESGMVDYSGKVTKTIENILYFELSAKHSPGKPSLVLFLNFNLDIDLDLEFTDPKLLTFFSGGYMAGYSSKSMRLGSLMLQPINSKISMDPAIIYPEMESYNNLPEQIRRYFMRRSNNLLKVPKILNIGNLDSFYHKRSGFTTTKKGFGNNQLYIACAMSKIDDELYDNLKKIIIELQTDLSQVKNYEN